MTTVPGTAKTTAFYQLLHQTPALDNRDSRSKKALYCPNIDRLDLCPMLLTRWLALPTASLHGSSLCPALSSHSLYPIHSHIAGPTASGAGRSQYHLVCQPAFVAAPVHEGSGGFITKPCRIMRLIGHVLRTLGYTDESIKVNMQVEQSQNLSYSTVRGLALKNPRNRPAHTSGRAFSATYRLPAAGRPPRTRRSSGPRCAARTVRL